MRPKAQSPRCGARLLLIALASLSASACRDVSCPEDTQEVEGRCIALDAVGVGPDGCVLVRYYADADGDGHGDPATHVDACEVPAGYAEPADDCDDACPTCWSGAEELCDGLDNDCDGAPDEEVVQTCGEDVGVCEAGAQRCVSGVFGACEGASMPAFAEVCDGALDEDCDGRVDEDCACEPGESRPCGTDVGACELGVQSCTDAGVFGACETTAGPSAEACNGRDDDCDGEVDEGNPGGGSACGSDVGLCAPGVSDCQGGAIV